MPKIIETRPNGTKRVVTVNQEPSKTDQSWKEETSADYIVKKFKQTGQITHLAKQAGQYADCSVISDLHTSLIQVQEAKEAFAQLPSLIRKKFDNDYKKLAMYQCDPDNYHESIEIGLVEAPEGYVKPDNKPVKKAETPAPEPTE